MNRLVYVTARNGRQVRRDNSDRRGRDFLNKSLDRFSVGHRGGELTEEEVEELEA